MDLIDGQEQSNNWILFKELVQDGFLDEIALLEFLREYTNSIERVNLEFMFYMTITKNHS
jgi:hypothetical protein